MRSELSHALRTERDRPGEVLEGGVGVSGERLEAGSVVGGLPSVGVAEELLREERPRLLVAARVCLRERDLEVLPRLRLERFPRLSADGDHERLWFDGHGFSRRIWRHVYDRRRPGFEGLLADREAHAAANDDVNLLVAIRFAVALDHRCPDRGRPAVDAESAHVEPLSQRHQDRRAGHGRKRVQLVEGDHRILALSHGYGYSRESDRRVGQ